MFSEGVLFLVFVKEIEHLQDWFIEVNRAMEDDILSYCYVNIRVHSPVK